MNIRFRKFVAGAQIVGGVALVASCIIELVTQPAARSVAGLVLYLAVFAYAAASAYFGTLLWKDRPSSYVPSVLIWGVQVPVIVSAPLSLGLSTGFGFVIQKVTTAVATGISFDFPLLERHVLYIAGQPEVSVVGVNLFAIYCAQALWLQREKHAVAG